MNTFDFLRLLAATAVVVAHSTVELHVQPSIWTRVFLPFPGVAMFFVMSGFLVFRSAERAKVTTGGYWQYFRNRWLRVAPAIYAFAIILPLALPAVSRVTYHDLLAPDMLAWLCGSFFLAPNVHPGAFSLPGHVELNGQLYTIPAEVSFYIVLPVIIWMATRWGFHKVLLVSIPIAVATPILEWTVTSYHVPRLLDHTFLSMVAYFMVGVFWARYWNRVSKHWGWFIIAMVVFSALHWFFAQHTQANHLFSPIATCVPLSYALLWFGYFGPKAFARLTGRVGDLSYGTYIWHVPIIFVFQDHGWLGSTWQVYAVLLTSWTFAWVSWHLLERRALLLKKVSERQAETGQIVPGGQAPSDVSPQIAAAQSPS